MVLCVLFVCKEAESETSYIGQHIDLTTDETVIDEVILVSAYDQHVLCDPIRNGLQVIELQLLRVPVGILRFVSIAAMLHAPVDDRRCLCLFSENQVQ